MFDRIAVAYWKFQKTGKVAPIEKYKEEFVHNKKEQESAINLLKNKKLRFVTDILSNEHSWS